MIYALNKRSLIGAAPASKDVMKKRPIDIQEASRLAALGLPIRMVAAVMRIPKSTLADRCKEFETLREAFEEGRGKALAELSGMLWEKARKGDTISLIYLSKVYGFRDTGPVPDAAPERDAITIYLPAPDKDDDTA